MQIRRLAFVLQHMNPWGGHDSVTLEIARRLSKRWPVDVIAFDLIDSQAKRNEWGKFRFLQVFPHFRKPALLLVISFHILNFIWLRVRTFLKHEPRPLIYSIGACSFVSDIVHVHFVQNAWEEKRKKLTAGTHLHPGIRSLTGWKKLFLLSYHKILALYILAIERLVYHPNRRYIAVSHGVARELKQYFGIERNVHVIHNGVDSERFSPCKSYEHSQDRDKIRSEWQAHLDIIVILFVGEYERKGLAVALEAVAMLPLESQERVMLVAIGGGDKAGFFSKAHALGIQSRVILIEHQRDIERYYRAADIFIMPTLYEPFGLVVLEAMATELPVLVSRIAGVSELIVDGVSGLLLNNPSDPAEISHSLAFLIAHPERRAEIGKKAREIAVRRSWDQVADECAKVVEGLF